MLCATMLCATMLCATMLCATMLIVMAPYKIYGPFECSPLYGMSLQKIMIHLALVICSYFDFKHFKIIIIVMAVKTSLIDF
jgi:hypothetical protein